MKEIIILLDILRTVTGRASTWNWIPRITSLALLNIATVPTSQAVPPESSYSRTQIYLKRIYAIPDCTNMTMP